MPPACPDALQEKSSSSKGSFLTGTFLFGVSGALRIGLGFGAHPGKLPQCREEPVLGSNSSQSILLGHPLRFRWDLPVLLPLTHVHGELCLQFCYPAAQLILVWAGLFGFWFFSCCPEIATQPAAAPGMCFPSACSKTHCTVWTSAALPVSVISLSWERTIYKQR